MTSEFRSHFLHQAIKLLHSAGCDCQRQQNDGQLANRTKIKTATSTKGRRFNFSFILINSYSSLPQSKPVGASMQGKVQEPLFLCKRNHSYGTAM